MSKPATEFPFYCPNCGEKRLQETQFCMQCGFQWESVEASTVGFGQMLGSLTDGELIIVVKALYKVMDALVANVAKTSDNSLGHVLRVMTRERTSVPIDRVIARTFRARCREQGLLPAIAEEVCVDSAGISTVKIDSVRQVFELK